MYKMIYAEELFELITDCHEKAAALKTATDVFKAARNPYSLQMLSAMNSDVQNATNDWYDSFILVVMRTNVLYMGAPFGGAPKMIPYSEMNKRLRVFRLLASSGKWPILTEVLLPSTAF